MIFIYIQYNKTSCRLNMSNFQDFEGVYKWKFLIPGLYVVSWLLMIFGPLFFPYPYQIFCIIIIVYSLLKTLGLTFGTLVALIMQYRTLKQLKIIKEQKALGSEQRIDENQFYHAIVIPSYKQEEQVLLQTLDILSKCQRSKTQFIVLLAMEAHEKGSDVKAKALIEKTKHNFLSMNFSQHVVQDGEMKGKASNVSWCVQRLQEMLPENMMIDPNSVIVTIIDADSWAPPEYFQKIELELKQRPQIKDRCMFTVPQIYTRNHLEVPVFNRIFDQMHSIVHLANLVAIHYSFPLSNYSISYNTAKKIGWWDTCADAIGQDFHTCQKCYWKLLDETVVTVPTYIPTNQLSLSTGQGYISDLKARFWQAERHTLGVTDVAYCWNMLFKTPFRFRNLLLTFLVTQVFAMAAVIPWALLALGIQYKLVNNPNIHFFEMWVIDLLLNATPIFTVSSYVFFQWWKRVANREVYHQQNDKWWRVLQYPILFMVALFGFSVPAFLMASFIVLCQTTEYKVAEKRIEKPKGIEGPHQHVHQDQKPLQNKDQVYKLENNGDQIEIVTESNSEGQENRKKETGDSMEMMKKRSKQQKLNEEEQGETANEMAKQQL